MLENNRWFTLEVVDGATLDAPGIYEWTIEGGGRYIGKFTRKSRPLRHYHRNVIRLITGHPYRLNKPDGFRLIHRELAKAATAGRDITLTILENPAPTNLVRRERELIKERGTLNRS